MADDALSIWRERLAHFQRELAITSDAAQKFSLQKQIEESEENIASLETQPGERSPEEGQTSASTTADGESSDAGRQLRARFMQDVNDSGSVPPKYQGDPSGLASILDRVDDVCAMIVKPSASAGTQQAALAAVEAAIASAVSSSGRDQPFAEHLNRYIRDLVGIYASSGVQPRFHDVFICHSSVDDEFARRLAGDLVSKGYRIWFDTFEMLVGDSLYEKIQHGIKSSSWFLIVLSPDAVTSKWCQRELHNAMEEEFEREKVYVLPVLFRDCDFPGFLKEKVWADCRGDTYEEGLEQVLRRLGRQPS